MSHARPAAGGTRARRAHREKAARKNMKFVPRMVERTIRGTFAPFMQVSQESGREIRSLE